MTEARAAELRYKRAFDEFARAVGRVQALLAQPDGDRQAVETARVNLEEARAAYIQARDEWAQYLLPSPEPEAQHKAQQHKAVA